MSTLCLTMIVKNESEVILRCLESVKDWIDYWVICDTGSTDNTKELITDFFQQKKIPGKLLEHKWKNFGYNRSKAIAASKNKADYCLLMDADFVFVPKDPKFKDKMGDADGYNIKYDGGLDFRQLLCVRSSLDWKYIGVTHEYINAPGASRKNFDGFTFIHEADGGCRSDKFTRDIQLLEEGIRDDPKNDRYHFYLAQSYKDIQNWDKAIENYQKRIVFGGWREEVYYSLYQIGKCKVLRGDPFHECMVALLKAYCFYPKRLEAIYYLINQCRKSERWALGYYFGTIVQRTEYPENDLLFIEKGVHEWMLLDEMAICAFYDGKYVEGLEIILRILNEDKYPRQQENRLQKHYHMFTEKVM